MHCKITVKNKADYFADFTYRGLFLERIPRDKRGFTVFQRQITKLENITPASYKVAQLIAKDKRPFADGDFVKKCMMAVAETVCSEKIKLFSGFSFSAQTITRRIRKISENVKYNQKDYFEDLQIFSIAIDESTDTTDTA